jgi:hypothetical protein
MLRRLILILTIGSLVALVAVNMDPVTTKLHRLVILCALVGIWLGPMFLLWKRKAIRIALAVIPVIAIMPFLLPGKEIKQAELREYYTTNLIAFNGTEYDWGGESGRGIDCSGLPRKAMRDALFSYGIGHFDGGCMRTFFIHWWNDASAKALAEGYLDFTFPTDQSGIISIMDYANLQPGDLVVTEDRRHILAYIGGEYWIQADPGAGKVIVKNGRTSSNGWFAVPVTSHRWSVLAKRIQK